MDFITHSLVGAGIARLAAPRRFWIQQLSLAGILGSLLMDGDSWLYLIDPGFYGKYHRVASHSIVGLTIMALISGAIPFLLFRWKPKWRCFGWFVSDNLSCERRPPNRAPFYLFFLISLAAAYAHFTADMITGFGNVKPFWPWSDWDTSLAAVNSFDWVLFALTLAWHVFLRQGSNRRIEFLISGGYVFVVFIYVAARYVWGPPAFI